MDSIKTIYKYSLIIFVVIGFLLSCSSNDDSEVMMDDDTIQVDDPNNPNEPQEPEMPFEMVSVQVTLPEGSSLDLSTTTMLSLGSSSNVTAAGQGNIPFNPGTVEMAYLLDTEDNVLLAGFVSDDRKEVSVASTVEVMLYYALEYYLLPDSAKEAFLNSVGQTPNFQDLIEQVTTLFTNDPMMYAEGTYLPALEAALDQITVNKAAPWIEKRIFFNDVATKSGVTLSSVDSTNINLENSLPRRSRVFIYKKSITDRNGTELEIPNYTNTPFQDFELEPGTTFTLEGFEVGRSVSSLNAQQASISEASATGPLLLPVNPATEFVAEYEVVLIGSGEPSNDERQMTNTEMDAYQELNKETYILNYFLPALMDVGGNKGQLAKLDGNGQEQIVNAILPILEQYPEVAELVEANNFREATQRLLPELYGNVRLSDDLRIILENIYNAISNNGDSPNTFIQSQELVQTGHPRFIKVLIAVNRNINAKKRANFGPLRTNAQNIESWLVKSIDAVVEMQQDNVELCLGEATELRVTVITDTDPEVEDFEFHWSTSNEFGGRVQDIGGDPNNFGVSIITKNNFVSYISTALESELNNGNNPEEVTVVLYFRNKNTGELTEAGRDTMTVNNVKGCVSFTVGFEQQNPLREVSDASCQNGIGYRASSPILYTAEFEAVEGATSYVGVITRSNGVVNDEIVLDGGIEDIGNGLLRFTTGVGSVRAIITCNQAQAEAFAEELLGSITVEPVSIEITPIF